MTEDSDQVRDMSFGQPVTLEEDAAAFSIPAPAANRFIAHITSTGVRITFAEHSRGVTTTGAESVRSAVTLSLENVASLHLLLGDLLRPYPEVMAEARGKGTSPQKDGE